MFENLYYYLNEPSDLQETLNLQSIETINQIAQIGDFFICGSERQRDLWIGVLAANQRVNPRTFSQDPDLRSLVDVVGIGFPDREPEHRPFLRGIHPLIPSDARIVLWGGGVWNWLDPLSLVKAWPRVLEQYPNARLIFLGTRHPNPLVPSHVIAEHTEALANEIGEKDRTILFFDWLPYDERERLLCEADIGVTLHPMHIETRYAIRTRVFDYFWAELPVLVSDGDVISEWIRKFNLGIVVPPQEVDSVADGLVSLLGMPKEAWAPQFEQIRDIFAWSRVVEPLRRYCLFGDFAPDRSGNRARPKGTNRKAEWHGLLVRARFILRSEGFLSLATKSGRYLRWKLSTLV